MTPGLGAKIRNLRKRQKMTQAGLAEMLGISSSYLNLMEHDRRPVTAPVLLQVAQIFDVDLKAFNDDGAQRTVTALAEVFGDEIFEGHDLNINELREFALHSPDVARAVETLYHSYSELRDQFRTLAERMSDQDLPGVEPWRLPSEEVSDLLQRHNNFFPTLEDFATKLWKDAKLERANLYTGLVQYLSDKHGIAVEIIEASPEDRAVRRFDPRRRLLQLSELLAPNTINFQLAHQIGLIELSDELDRLVTDRHLTTDESRALARVALSNYFAGAVLMPYDEFLQAAKAQRYDIDMLGHRFRASFEQVAHRLTTLRKPGHEGVRFHFLRVDIAGNISKRFSASGIQFARFSGACPRWNLVVAFMTPGQIRTQVSIMANGERFFCIARTVNRGERGFHSPPALHAICLGCRVEEAHDMIYSEGVALDNLETSVPVGVTCRLCDRMDCEQRAFPPMQRTLHIDENVRGFTFYASLKE
ncbi:MAG: short-chain fatty acyl-CoA regulator family protein [bacterium]